MTGIYVPRALIRRPECRYTSLCPLSSPKHAFTSPYSLPKTTLARFTQTTLAADISRSDRPAPAFRLVPSKIRFDDPPRQPPAQPNGSAPKNRAASEKRPPSGSHQKSSFKTSNTKGPHRNRAKGTSLHVLRTIQQQRRDIDEVIAKDAMKYPGFIFNQKSYGIEFEARWNSLYPLSVIRSDWRRKFTKLWSAKELGRSNADTWNRLEEEKWSIVADWAKNFTNASSGRKFWHGLKKSNKGAMWPSIALWLMIYSPANVMNFLETTSFAPHPPFRMVADCFLYLDRFFYEELTRSPEEKHHYHRTMDSVLGPARWPVLHSGQSSLRTYLKRCEPATVEKAFDKVHHGEITVDWKTLLYLLDLFIESGNAEYSLRALREYLRRTRNWTAMKEHYMSRCCRLLALDTTDDENGARRFKLLPAILELGIQPQREIVNAVMRNALRLGDSDMAWDLFKDSKIPPDAFTYLILLDDSTKQGDVQKMETLRRLIFADPELVRHPHTLSKALHGLTRETTPETESRLFNDMIQAYCLGHDPRPLKDLGIVQDELDTGEQNQRSPPSQHALYLMVIAYLRLHKSSTLTLKVYQRFCELVRQGHESVGKLAETDHVFNAFLSALQPDEHMVSQSISIVRDMYETLPDTAFLKGESRAIKQARPSMITWNIILNTAMIHREFDTIAVIRKMMSEQNVPMDTPAWNSILQGYARYDMVDEYSMAIHQMLLENLRPDDYTFSSLQRMRDQHGISKALIQAGINPETLSFYERPTDAQ